MIPMYNAGDRVTIDWEAAKGKDLFEYELNYFPKDCECYGTVLQDFDRKHREYYYVIIEWDTRYHNKMHGDNHLEWNLSYQVVKKIKPTNQKKLIEQRINKLYSKCKTTAHWSK